MTYLILFYCMCSITGSVIASFAAVVGHRVPIKQSIYRERSHCDHCRKILTMKNLVPVFSYLLQRGKCTNCAKKIPFDYFFIEVLGTIAGSLLAHLYLHTLHLNYLQIIILWLTCFILCISDWQYYLVPDKILFVSFLSITATTAIYGRFAFLHWSDAFITLTTLSLISYLYKNRLGGGDIKFITLLSWYFGLYSTCIILLIATSLAIIYYFVIHQLSNKKKAIPFIPFLSFGTFLLSFIQ